MGRERSRQNERMGAPDSPAATAPPVFRIAFVCTGNICRSPMAEVVFRDLVQRAGLADRVSVTSAGTGDWHVGEQADARTLAALERRGLSGCAHRAKQFDPDTLPDLDLVVVFDRGQERTLRQWARTEADRAKIHLLLSFDPPQAHLRDVPDPYYTDAAMFDRVLGMIDRAARALLAQVEPGIRPPS